MNEVILKIAYNLYSNEINEKRKIKPAKLIAKLSYNYFINHMYMIEKYINNAININRINKLKKLM